MVADKSVTSVLSNKTWSKDQSSEENNILHSKSSISWLDQFISSRNQLRNEPLNPSKSKFYLDSEKFMTTLKISNNEISNNINITSSGSDNEFTRKLDGTVKNLNCLTPYKQMVWDNFPNKFLMLHDLRCCKLNSFTEIIGSESSKQDNTESNDERLLKQYISKTVNGWDEKGMHYWLHKVGKSNLYLPLIEEISVDSDSWYRIHVCENCIIRLNSCNHACCNRFGCLPEESDKSSLQETIFNGSLTNKLFKNDQIILQMDHEGDFSGQENCYSNDKNKDITKTLSCNDQYFKRAVYSYNTCSLNFNHEEIYKKVNKLDSSLKPFFKVVVYDGTDPCGLKFPTDFGGKESHSILFDSCKQAKDVNLNSTVQNEDYSLPNICKHSSYTTSLETNSTCINTISLKTDSSKFSEKWSSMPSNDKWETISSSGSFDLISETSTTLSTDKNSGFQNSVIFKDFYSFNPLQYNTDTNSKSTSMQTKKTSLSHKSQSLDSISVNEKLILHKKLYRASRKLNKTKYPTNGKRLEIFIESDKASHKSLVAYLNKLSNKKQSPNLAILFDKTSKMSIQMVYFGKACNRILISDRKSKRTKLQKSNENFTAKILNCFKIVWYTLFIIFFIFTFVLIEDSFKSEPENSKNNKWYNL